MMKTTCNEVGLNEEIKLTHNKLNAKFVDFMKEVWNDEQKMGENKNGSDEIVESRSR